MMEELKNLDKVLKLSIIGFVLTNGIYFLSDYLPNLYYFSNRVMGASKLLFGVVLVAGVFYISKKFISSLHNFCYHFF